MMKKRKLVLLLASITAASCGDGVYNDEDSKNSSETVFNELREQGLNCATQASILSLDEGQQTELVGMVQSSMSSEQIGAMVGDRESSCSPTGDLSGDIGSISQAITTNYKAELIEETSGSGGYAAVYILTDGAAFGHMCGNDGDYIAEFDSIPGAFANRSSLRIRGTNWFASCYLANPTAARVYDDNDIRACIGWWSVFFCGGGGSIPPYPNEMRIWY